MIAPPNTPIDFNKTIDIDKLIVKLKELEVKQEIEAMDEWLAVNYPPMKPQTEMKKPKKFTVMRVRFADEVCESKKLPVKKVRFADEICEKKQFTVKKVRFADEVCEKKKFTVKKLRFEDEVLQAKPLKTPKELERWWLSLDKMLAEAVEWKEWNEEEEKKKKKEQSEKHENNLEELMTMLDNSINLFSCNVLLAEI